jgi:hypothetical protein
MITERLDNLAQRAVDATRIKLKLWPWVLAAILVACTYFLLPAVGFVARSVVDFEPGMGLC